MTGNGTISREEFKHVMIEFNHECTDETLEQYLKVADVDGDGIINLNDFKAMLGVK